MAMNRSGVDQFAAGRLESTGLAADGTEGK